MQDLDLSVVRFRLLPRDYAIADAEQVFSSIRDLLMVVSATSKELDRLRAAAAIEQGSAGTLTWSEITGDKVGALPTPTAADELRRLRRQYGQDVRVLRISMDSPMEIVVALAGGGAMIYVAVDRVMKIRERVHQSNAQVAEFQAKKADFKAKKAISEVTEQTARAVRLQIADYGFETSASMQPSIDAVIKNVAIAASRIDQVQIEQ